MMATSRTCIAVWLCLFLAFFSGCAGIGKTLEPPRVSLANFQVREVKIFESVFQVELRVFNTNDIPLEIKGLHCELELNGKKVATGVSDVNTEVPSYGTATVPVLLYSSMVDMARGILGLQKDEKLRYKISGKVRIGGGPMMPSSVPFESEGEVPMGGGTGSTQNRTPARQSRIS